jgi:hypothetical protein
MKTRRGTRMNTRRKIGRRTRRKTGGEEDIVWKKHRSKTYYYINYYQSQTHKNYAKESITYPKSYKNVIIEKTKVLYSVIRSAPAKAIV